MKIWIRQGRAAPLDALALALGLLLGAPAPTVAGQASATDERGWDAGELVASVLTASDAGTEEGSAASPIFKWAWKKKLLAHHSYASMAVDSQGRPHVLSMQVESGIGVSVMHTWSDGKDWLSESIDSGLLWASRVAATIDSQDVLHVAYSDYFDPLGGNDDALYLRYAHNAGGTWQVETVERGGDFPSVALAEDDTVHIVHVLLDTQPTTDREVRHAELTPSGWAMEVLGTLPPDYGGTHVLVRDGVVYATFTASNVMLRLATRDEGVWSIEDIDEGLNGGLAFDAEGVPHVVHRIDLEVGGEKELRHAWRVDDTWQHETLLTSTSLFGVPIGNGIQLHGDQADLIADPGGRIQMVFRLGASKGGATGSAVMTATFQDGLWLPRKLGPANAGSDPSIAVTRSGIVHAVTAKQTSGPSDATLALMLKGRKLLLRVTPPLAGTITDTVTGLTCDHKLVENYYPGTEVTLTATPAPGFVFAGWASAGSGTEPECVVTLNKSRKVVARFEPLER